MEIDESEDKREHRILKFLLGNGTLVLNTMENCWDVRGK